MTKWCFIHEGRLPSGMNMQKDGNLFGRVQAGEIPGFFRIYNWQTPAVTLGYHQKDFRPWADMEIETYDRPTGGGAVLHYDDITYSIATRNAGFFSGGISEIYSAIAEIFRKALNRCGVDAGLCERDPGFAEVCFARTARKELVLDGYKIMGAAQVRRRGFFLQQGVLPLRVDQGLYAKVFGDSRQPAGILDLVPEFDPTAFVAALRRELELAAGISFLDCQDDQGQGGHADGGEVDLR